MNSVLHTFAALTATGNTPSIDLISKNGSLCSKHSVQAVITGTPDSATGKIQGSVDGIVFVDFAAAADITAGAVLTGVDKLFRFIRVNLATLVNGTTPTVTFRYIGLP